MSRWGLRRSMAFVLAGMAVLSACTSTEQGEPTVAPDPAAPQAIEFAVAAEPSMTTDAETLGDAHFLQATVIDEHLVVGDSTRGVTVFAMDDATPVWSLKSFGGKVGEGSTRSLPMRTSSAAGGIVLAGYIEECFWERAPCSGAPEDTRSILGVAAVAAADGDVVWRAELAYDGGTGSVTEDDGIYLEPEVVDADADSVLVTLATDDGAEAPSGTAGMTTVLLDAETGEEQWRVSGFRGGFLNADVVLGVSGEQVAPGEPHPAVVTDAVDRETGKAVDTGSGSAGLWVESAGGPAAVIDDRSENGMETRNIHVLGPDGRPVATAVDEQNLAQAECPEPDVEEMLACAVMARNTDSLLVTWADGEAEPTVVPAPLRGHQQVRAVSGDVLLISENGYYSGPSDDVPTWFAARRDGTVISARYPGTAVAASEDYVVTRTITPDRTFVFNTWQITQRP